MWPRTLSRHSFNSGRLRGVTTSLGTLSLWLTALMHTLTIEMCRYIFDRELSFPLVRRMTCATSFHTDSSQSFLSRTGNSVLKSRHTMRFLMTRCSSELKCFSECFYLLNESWITSLLSTLFQIKKIGQRAAEPLSIPLNYHNVGLRT